MTDRYSLPPKPGDPLWAVSREPAPPLYVRWCVTPNCANSGLSHLLETEGEKVCDERAGFTPMLLVEGTGSPAPRAAQQGKDVTP